jgi:peroxiredoxin
MLIEDKVIKKLIIEKDPGVCDLTNASEILKFI